MAFPCEVGRWRQWMAQEVLEYKVPDHAFAMSIKHATRSFGAVTNFEGDDVTIALQGTTETGAAFELAAVLNAAVDLRPASIVVCA